MEFFLSLDIVVLRQERYIRKNFDSVFDALHQLAVDEVLHGDDAVRWNTTEVDPLLEFAEIDVIEFLLCATDERREGDRTSC